MATIERALAIAATAHTDQLDKGGAPYILHPLRIMMKMPTTESKMVAILHDVVEDSDWTLENLREEGFSEAVIAGVDCMTRRDDESYATYIERLKTNSLALQVKMGDLTDNMNLLRLNHLDEKAFKRYQRYHSTYFKLKPLLDK